MRRSVKLFLTLVIIELGYFHYQEKNNLTTPFQFTVRICIFVIGTP